MGKVEGYLSPLAVSEYTGLSIDAVKELMDNDTLETIELKGTQKVRKSEVDRWLDEQASSEELLDLLAKLKESPNAGKVAELLDMEEEEVKEHLDK